MDIDKRMLENAAKLPEAQLQEIIGAVVAAAGGSKMQARAAAANSGTIRNKLEGITDGEIAELTKSIDPQTMAKILEAVKAKGGLDRG